MKTNYVITLALAAALTLTGGVLATARAADEHAGHHGAKTQNAKTQTATVTVTGSGYQPSRVTLKKGVPARLTFIRKSNAGCGTEVLLPGYNINKKLPLNKPVTVAFTPKQSGTFAFTCGMKMLKGKVVVP